MYNIIITIIICVLEIFLCFILSSILRESWNLLQPCLNIMIERFTALYLFFRFPSSLKNSFNAYSIFLNVKLVASLVKGLIANINKFSQNISTLSTFVQQCIRFKCIYIYITTTFICKDLYYTVRKLIIYCNILIKMWKTNYGYKYSIKV